MGASRWPYLFAVFQSGIDRLAGDAKLRRMLSKVSKAIDSSMGAGNYDPEGDRSGENRLIGAVGAVFTSPWAVDIGANEGLWTMEVRSRIPSSHVLSVEPGTQALELLRHRTMSDLNVHVFPVALGAVDGTEKLFGHQISVHASLNSQVLSRTTFNRATDIPAESVEVRTWDSIVQLLSEHGFDLAFQQNIIVKIDIEGLELEALKQLANWPGYGNVQVVQFEFNMHAMVQGQLIEDFQRTLGSDFDLFRLSPRSLIPFEELSRESAHYFGFSNWVGIRRAKADELRIAYEAVALSKRQGKR